MVRWLVELNSIVITSTWVTFHEDYCRIVEPILPRLHPQASQLFAKITPDSFHARWYGSHYYEIDPTFSVNELEAFIDTYQQFRLVRAEMLAVELYRLADIYETHPTRLKQPFDTRIQVPNAFNAQHVPTQMRHEARKRVRRAKNARWNSREVKPSRFMYPPLVPYESQLQSFCDGLEDIANKQGIDGERSAPVEIVEKCQAVVQNAPDWAREDAEGEMDTAANLCKTLERQHMGRRGLTPNIRIRASGFQSAGLPVLLRGDSEVGWLGDFAEATAWLEEWSRRGLKHID